MKQKDLFFSIDSLRLTKTDCDYCLRIGGWAFRNYSNTIGYRLKVNGNETDITWKPVQRSDAFQKHKKFLKDRNDSLGFSVIAHWKEEPHSISFDLVTGTGNYLLIKLSQGQINKILQNQTIEYYLDSFTVNEDKTSAVAVGWALDFTNQQPVVSIYDDFDTLIGSSVRFENRPDLLRLGIIEKRNSLCGFRVTFPFEEGRQYRLVLSSDYCTKTVRLRKQKPHILGPLAGHVRNLKPGQVKNAYSYLRKYGVRQFCFRVKEVWNGQPDYDAWFRMHRISADELEEQKKTEFIYTPKISLIVATFNTKERYLEDMIGSLLRQSYTNWELCIADGSDHDGVFKYVDNLCSADSRIKYRKLQANYGISGNMNAAWELATGDYIGLYDHDDFLELDTLFEVVKALQDHPYDVVYSDEDKFDDSKKVYADPNFKPDFNVDLFRSHNYITHFFVVKSDIVRRIGLMKAEYDGAQDYDFMFRVFEQTQDIYHIPKILYHWRMHNLSTAMDPESKQYCYDAGRNAIADHLKRIGVTAEVSKLPKPFYGCYETKYTVRNEPLVSVIIPNKDNRVTLETCIRSLYEVNKYNNIEVLIVENNSTDPETFAYYEVLEKKYPNLQILSWKDAFNYSSINNFAAERSKGEYLLFLNNDTEMIKPDSIENMLGICQRPEVGAVGAKLLYEDDTVQHAGVVIGFGGYAGHVNTGIGAEDAGYMMRARLNCDYSAVTAACMMIRKSVFETVGGFDPQFVVACNDVDLCLKIRALGLLVVYDAFSIWHHYESKTRGYEDSQAKIDRFNGEVARFQDKWKDVLSKGDPYYNSNFDITRGPFEY
ncbi:glycosyltransferase family 2 protein [uncultured Faecalibaculum sp.]|uniref:glycosyltransferase family 2 protein n=1 Tax=uncultured Faecalibaculum sp. TaxID=1729681 RepID=UPI0025E4D27A|nr:glycosyltransferase family 2 protein [uncultured Faecalibaculum sp.]